MKGQLAFDPDDYDYGPATPAVRRIFREWEAIDWFCPPEHDLSRARAVRLFEEHQRLAHALLPHLFPTSITVRAQLGGFDDFIALYNRVRSGNSRWDWKFSCLKVLSNEHARARGWTRQEVAKHGNPSTPPQLGDLYFVYQDQVICLISGPKLQFEKALPETDAPAANWYAWYASMDIVSSIEWQLAERGVLLDKNPFLPLLRCYAERFYPFSLGPSEYVLFGLKR